MSARHPLAVLAIRAEKMRRNQGQFAAQRFAERHGVLRLYHLACRLADGGAA